MVDGTRVSKADPRMVAVGMVDGLNSMVGVCIMEVARLPSIHQDGGPMTHADRLKEHLLVKLRRRQHELFDLGAELACPASSIPEGMAALGEEESDRLLEEMESAARGRAGPHELHPTNRTKPSCVPSHGTDPRKGPGAPSGQVARTSWLRCASCHPAVCQPTLGLGLRPRSSHHAWPGWDGIVVGPQIRQGDGHASRE